MKILSIISGTIVLLGTIGLFVSILDHALNIPPGTPDEGFVLDNGGHE